MVFDKAQKVDICKLKDQGGLALKSITQDPSDTSTILRLVTVEGVNPTIRRDGFAWIFDFKKQLFLEIKNPCKTISANRWIYPLNGYQA